ncbi:MAG TPA: transcriptional repressor [Thermodesulfobacteriota bacterium]|nr:transcriptional repressor [Thermodesulfobacteriota bacterium]
MTLKTRPKAERKKALEEFIAKKRLKSTKQRDIIFDEFFNYLGQHVTVEDLYEKIKRSHPRIGYATIYRTLKLFKECGLAFERNFGDGRTRYEPVKFEGEHHDHLICVGCGKIIEFANNQIESCSKQVARLNGFEVVNHKLELYGYCSSCREGGSVNPHT